LRKSSEIPFLLRLVTFHHSGTPFLCGASSRSGSPLPGSSTLMTSAPRSANSVAANGPATTVDMSRIRSPTSGPVGAGEAEDAAEGFMPAS